MTTDNHATTEPYAVAYVDSHGQPQTDRFPTRDDADARADYLRDRGRSAAVTGPGEELEHLVWANDLRFAFRAGLDVQAVCGAWVQPWEMSDACAVETDDSAVPVYHGRDCPACQETHARTTLQGVSL